MSANWKWVRLVAGVAILAVLVWRLGTGPFLDGLRRVSFSALAAAIAINVVATVCCAWRWCLVARGLGVGLPLRTAVAAYYRSQFLNSALPGGVLGDVHRAVAHGRDVGDVGRGVRAVVWERTAGQLVQLVLALIVLAALPSPVRAFMPLVLLATLLALLVAAAWFALRGRRPGGWRWVRTARADVREGLLRRSQWPGITAASIIVVAAHTTTFVIAARTAGTSASVLRLLPLAILVLLVMAVPINIGGWGPREGVAAWLFGAAGLGAGLGVAAATVYGVMVIAASLPGAAVLLAPRLTRGARRRRAQREPWSPPRARVEGPMRG